MKFTPENLIENIDSWSIFAELHPIEAYDLDNKRFCDYFRTKHVGATDEMIAEIINEHR